MNKLTQRELENLAKIYLQGRNQLLDVIVNYKGVGTRVYYNSVLKHLNWELRRLRTATNKFIDTSIPREYHQGLKAVYSYFTRNNLLMKRPDIWADIHTDAIYGIAREMQYHIDQGLAQVGRQVLRYAETARDEALRSAGLLKTGEKIASGSTTNDMKNWLIKQLQDEGFMTVQYGQGAGAYQVPLDTYANMVVRSTTREAGNQAMENQLSENGYDLVEMSTHYPTCEVCAPLQGRVYSISGKDKRFPALSIAFSSGYHNVHPNCRHVIVPWIESLQTPEEVQAAIVKSNKPLKDTRSRREVELYMKQQGENRRARQDLYQYERYKARLGDDAPKSFYAFSRMKKAGGDPWKRLKKMYAISHPKYDKFTFHGVVITKEGLAKLYPDFDRLQVHYARYAHKETLKHGLKVGTEKAVAMDITTGQSAFTTTGTRNSTAIDARVLQAAPDNSILLVHNHPNSSSFSPADLGALNDYPSMRAISVQAHDGTLYTAEIGSSSRVPLQDIDSQYNRIRRSGVYSGLSWEEESHRTIEELCNNFGWEYRRVSP